MHQQSPWLVALPHAVSAIRRFALYRSRSRGASFAFYVAQRPPSTDGFQGRLRSSGAVLRG